jgi:hypothetical protein
MNDTDIKILVDSILVHMDMSEFEYVLIDKELTNLGTLKYFLEKKIPITKEEIKHNNAHIEEAHNDEQRARCNLERAKKRVIRMEGIKIRTRNLIL